MAASCSTEADAACTSRIGFLLWWAPLINDIKAIFALIAHLHPLQPSQMRHTPCQQALAVDGPQRFWSRQAARMSAMLLGALPPPVKDTESRSLSLLQLACCHCICLQLA